MSGPFYFAWSGGTLQDQVTVVTSGDTHGGVPPTIAIVADCDGSQLLNLASTQGLEQDALYWLADNTTFFVFDDSILSGQPNSINLSQPQPAAKSATYLVKKSVPAGVVAGNLSQGSNVVTFAADLPAGVYGIYGTGIGQTFAPVGTTSGATTTFTDNFGTPITIVGSAYLVYDGNGAGEMFILVASPNDQTGFDPETGQPTNAITYSVQTQQVAATTSGQFSLELTGLPNLDAFSITNMDPAALATLSAGLVYNIAGNGLQIGSTFVAPSGTDEVELDLAATTSTLNALLTITGPRTPSEPFDPSVHNRFDEDVISFDIDQEQGGFATLSISLKNPNFGLLAAGRQLWCWLSWDQNYTEIGGVGNDTPDLVPLFTGQLLGVAALQVGEVVQLQFRARPDDYNAQKTALAASLQVLPYYDPVWLAANVNPDTVLEAYSALWHIDRISLALTTSDILEGEDGIVEVGEGEAIYDAFSLSYGQPPLTSVTVSGTVAWDQEGEGTVDVSQNIVSAFAAAGSPYKQSFPVRSGFGGGGLITCVCGDGLKTAWPAPGTSIGGGWSLSTHNDSSGYPLCYIIEATLNNQGGWIQSIAMNVSFAAQTAPAAGTPTSDVNAFTAPFGQYSASFPINVYKIRMNLDYKAYRKRTETVTAVVTADVQRVLSDSAESDREEVNLTSQYVAQGVDLDGGIPIGNIAYRSYFQTTRGTSSWEYLLLVAIAKLRARSRAVHIDFKVDWRTALGITLRNSVRYSDRRVPGGVATGKVSHYKLSAGNGRMEGEFRIGCAIGTGIAASTSAPAVNSYSDGYSNPGYQTVSGQVPLADLFYQSLDDFVIDDDGLDIGNLGTEACNECVVTNGLTVQLTSLQQFQFAGSPVAGNPINTMQTLTTMATLDMKPVQGSEFHTEFTPAVTPLALPQGIDLTQGPTVVGS